MAVPLKLHWSRGQLTQGLCCWVVSSYAHLCHFSRNKPPSSLPCQNMDLGSFEGCCLHTHISSKLCKEIIAFLRVVSIDKLINISAPIGEPLSGVAGHKTCLARPLVGNTVPPVISGNSRVRKKSSGGCWKCGRSLPSDLSCCTVMSACVKACSLLLLCAAARPLCLSAWQTSCLRPAARQVHVSGWVLQRWSRKLLAAMPCLCSCAACSGAAFLLPWHQELPAFPSIAVKSWTQSGELKQMSGFSHGTASVCPNNVVICMLTISHWL